MQTADMESAGSSREPVDGRQPTWLRNLLRVVDHRRRVGKSAHAATPSTVSDDLTINFEGFMNWYRRFESRSGKQLLAVNFDTSVLAHLKEVVLLLLLLLMLMCFNLRRVRRSGTL
jgi:hypothetical protein